MLIYLKHFKDVYGGCLKGPGEEKLGWAALKYH
jgi:hypothetical protein